MYVKDLITNKIYENSIINIFYSICKINQVKAYYRQFKPKTADKTCYMLELFMPSVLY